MLSSRQARDAKATEEGPCANVTVSDATCKLFGLGSVMLDVFKEEAYMSDKVRPVPGSALLGAWPAP